MTEDEMKTPWPDPTPDMLKDPQFNAIWQVIKSWDINVPAAYAGYCGATGNHVRAIFDALAPAMAEEIKRLRAENERLAKDWNTVREAHDNLVSELDLRLVERRALRALNAELVEAGEALISFYYGPTEAKRPDVFQMLMRRLENALPPVPARAEGR